MLELGGGQGWAACVYKRLFSNAHVTFTDMSKYAVMSLPKWERVFERQIDNAYACTSYDIDEHNASVDLIFCFASAHHFLAHKRTLQELSRVLKPRARAIYFHEPATPRYLYLLAYWRVNRKRPEVPEDVLIIAELRTLAEQAGLDMEVDYDPSLKNRGAFEPVYFFTLGPYALPSTALAVFRQDHLQKERRLSTRGPYGNFLCGNTAKKGGGT